MFVLALIAKCYCLGCFSCIIAHKVSNSFSFYKHVSRQNVSIMYQTTNNCCNNDTSDVLFLYLCKKEHII